MFQLYTLAAGVLEFFTEVIKGWLMFMPFYAAMVTKSLEMVNPDSIYYVMRGYSSKLPLALYFWLLGRISSWTNHR